MPEMTKTEHRKLAANLRQRMRRGGTVSPEELAIIESWELKRSPRGKKSFFKASGPGPGGADQAPPETEKPAENPDDVDTVPDMPAPPRDDDAPAEVIQDEPIAHDTARVAPPPPPRVSARGKDGKYWRTKYEHASGGGTREQTCRMAAYLVINKVAIPAIEFHERYEVPCPVRREDLLPQGSGPSEIRPVIFDDAVVCADEFLPKDIVAPPGLIFGITMGLLFWSTWKLNQAVESGTLNVATAAPAPASAPAPAPAQAHAQEPAQGQEPTKPKNGAAAPPAYDGRLF